MAKIEILKNTAANANPVYIGDVIEVTNAIAVQLIRSGKAKEYVVVQAVAQEEPKPVKVAKAKASKSKSKAKSKAKTTQKKDK